MEIRIAHPEYCQVGDVLKIPIHRKWWNPFTWFKKPEKLLVVTGISKNSIHVEQLNV